MLICFILLTLFFFNLFLFILSNGDFRLGLHEGIQKAAAWHGVCASFLGSCCQRFQMTAAADHHHASLHKVCG